MKVLLKLLERGTKKGLFLWEKKTIAQIKNYIESFRNNNVSDRSKKLFNSQPKRWKPKPGVGF